MKIAESLLRTYIRQIILESPMSDYFGKSFSEFERRFEKGEDPIHVADDLFKRLGQGSHRIAYEIPDNKDHVVKIINTQVKPAKDLSGTQRQQRGLRAGEDIRGFTKKQKLSANRLESDLRMQQKYPEVFPRTFEVSDDRSWIVSERVVPVDKTTFYKFLGLEGEGEIEPVPFLALVDLIINHFKYESDPDHWSHPFFASSEDEDMKTVKINEEDLYSASDTIPFSKADLDGPEAEVPDRILQSPVARRVRKMIQDPHNEKIFRAMADLNIPAREFRRDNVGLSTVGEPKLVLLDASLWEKDETV